VGVPLTVGSTGGKLALTHHRHHASTTFSSRTCPTTLTSSGTYKITAGAGRYRGVRGHGDYKLVAYAIVAKVDGKCETKGYWDSNGHYLSWSRRRVR
jgi:hypothetical protein